MQQAGPSYLVVATRMHFQRTAGLEQEIENLKKKLAACTRDNLNLQEELSEAYRIKSQLADLHAAEVTKVSLCVSMCNVEAEKQLKFFQGCVAAAFAERDNSIMEAEKAKEKEELMSQKFNEFHKRLEELTSDCLEQKNLNATLQADLAKEEELNETFKEVINKFYEIRQQAVGGFEDKSWDDKCACLLQDPVEMWSFNDTSTSKYISALEDELEKMKSSAESLQSKLRMGLEIENHLKNSVRELEKKIFHSNKFLINGIVELRHFHSQHKVDIMNLLDEGRSHIISISDMVQENIQQFEMKGPGLSDAVAERKGDTSEALALALQEKVAALLLLSQQEERHLLEKNVNVALQMKIEELQRNLLQVTNEKVKALVELAQLKQEYHLLQEKINGKKQGKDWAEIGENRLVTPDRDGRLRNLFKKTYLRRWIGAQDLSRQDTQARLNNAGDMTARSTSSMDFARMKIENATLKESMESMEHLTSSVHRLRLSLSKVKESATSEGTVTTSMFEALDEIVTEAKLIKTALGSSLPLSWSADADDGSIG
ncbi:hypothetical protein Pint_33667 [Pistacia integerrima]|uniref:Uncharacterized protein n=1 Tax=Pistacia integerrima TaxID=434235 RepID=A0ACC0X4W7_9ROSI|nr:hypothetical protein Pint_33667 [Pistacia integerrima]